MSHDKPSICPRLPDGILVEGIVTTFNDDGSPHIAPMGPIVDHAFSRLLLRPFRTSVTYRNLKRGREGVFHVTDDVELLARAAVGQLIELPRLEPATAVKGVLLSDACRWYAFRVEMLDDSEERTAIVANVVDSGRFRDFLGFNRAKHAVIEAAILATRIDFLEAPYILDELERLSAPVTKTGSHAERNAFEFLKRHIGEEFARRNSAETSPG
jgi:hypothetical protein